MTITLGPVGTLAHPLATSAMITTTIINVGTDAEAPERDGVIGLTEAAPAPLPTPPGSSGPSGSSPSRSSSNSSRDRDPSKARPRQRPLRASGPRYSQG